MSFTSTQRTPQKSNSYLLRSSSSQIQKEVSGDTGAQQQAQIAEQISNQTIVLGTNTPASLNVIEHQGTRNSPIYGNNSTSATLCEETAAASSIGNLSVRDLESLVANITRTIIANGNLNTSEDTNRLSGEIQSSFPQTNFDKIPDTVKCLREFSGTAADFNAWRNSVDRVLELYHSCIGSARYLAILSVIRNKITGDADAVLDSYDVKLEWKDIRTCLTLHYGERRDTNTLESEMASLTQGEKSFEEFYQSIHSHLSLIINKITRTETNLEAKNALIKCYKQKALAAFIKGLKGDLPRLIALREPSDLPQALNLVIKLENQASQTRFAGVNHYKNNWQQNTSSLEPYNQQRIVAAPQYSHRANMSNNNARSDRITSWRNSNREQIISNRNNSGRPHSNRNNAREHLNYQKDFNRDTSGQTYQHNINRNRRDHPLQSSQNRSQLQPDSRHETQNFPDVHFLE